MLFRQYFVLTFSFLSCVLGLMALLANPKGKQYMPWIGVIRYDTSTFDNHGKLLTQKDWFSINAISICQGHGKQALCFPTVYGKFHGKSLHPDGKPHEFFGTAVVLMAGLAGQSLACGYAFVIFLLVNCGKMGGIKSMPVVHLGLSVGSILGFCSAATGTGWVLVQSTVATTGEARAPVSYYPVWIAFVWIAFACSCTAGALEVGEKYLPMVICRWIWRQFGEIRQKLRH